MLVGAAHGAAVGLADDRDDGHVVQLGVVQAVEQVDGARAEVAMHTPTRPVNFAYPTASKAAMSSCLAWMNWGSLSAPAPGGQDA